MGRKRFDSKSGEYEEATLTQVDLRDTGKIQPLAASVARAQLVILRGYGAGRRFDIDDDLLGRGGESTILIDDLHVSRHHARVWHDMNSGDYFIQDQGSRNGTLVNAVPLEGPYKLCFGDKISFGGATLMLFTPYDDLEEQLLQSQKMEAVGQLAGGVSHDFNNLLGVVLSNINYLKSFGGTRPLADPSVQAALVDIETAAERAAELTQQLLDFARHKKPQRQEVNVSWLTEEVVRLTQRTFDRSIEIIVDAEPLLHVVGDSAQLHQVLMNLCINARDAMTEGGLLELTARRLDEGDDWDWSGVEPGSYALITVTDNGIGMDEDTARRAFEPFFTTKRESGGSGLGLSTVYGIVKSHGGEVRICSGEGSGTTVRVYLPLVEGAVEGVQRTVALTTVGGDVQGEILLVDDDELVLRSSQRLLESLGYRVRSAPDGQSSVELFKMYRDRIALVIVDLMMPGLDGRGTIRALREVDPSAKILLISGYADHQRVQEVLADGASSFAPKPLDVATLKQAIAQALQSGKRASSSGPLDALTTAS